MKRYRAARVHRASPHRGMPDAGSPPAARPPGQAWLRPRRRPAWSGSVRRANRVRP